MKLTRPLFLIRTVITALKERTEIGLASSYPLHNVCWLLSTVVFVFCTPPIPILIQKINK